MTYETVRVDIFETMAIFSLDGWRIERMDNQQSANYASSAPEPIKESKPTPPAPPVDDGLPF